MTELTLIRSPAEEALLTRFPDFAARQAHWGGAALARRRGAAFETLKTRGLPTRRVEDWKYTDLRAFMRELPGIADLPPHTRFEAAAAETDVLDVGDAHRIQFVNGHALLAGTPEGVAVYRLAGGDALPPTVAAAVEREHFYETNAAVALNTAFMHDVTILHVPAGVTLARPLHLAFRTTTDAPLASFARVLLLLDGGATATLIETHRGPDGVAYHANSVIEIALGEGARVDHIRCNVPGDAALSLSTLGIRAAGKARIDSFAMTRGGAMTRHQIFVALDGEGTQLALQGATLLQARQHADNTMVIDHLKGHCTGRELFKSVLDGESRSVFQGKIIVRPDAQKTDGKMSAHALLLSETAEADAKPELEIFADDVVCGHGATAGALDDELLFYLKARGIPQQEAEALMVQAFVGEAIEAVADERLRESLNGQVRAWLAARN